MVEKPAKKASLTMFVGTTYEARDSVAEFISKAKRMENETEDMKKLRMKRHECKSCFYIYGRIGGSMMVTQPCMVCGKPVIYSSTCTDALCMDCAVEHKLCKHCGGDLEMRIKRRNWPTK